ncbi:MAG: PP2C family protein-serine/threonine phosphatase, partial [Calditrichaceae bacterium]
SNPDILFSFSEFTRCIKNMNFGRTSMCLTMLKISDHTLRISTAGMPPTYIYRSESGKVEEYLFKGMPLGAMEKFPYELKETILRTGDTILMLSDGLPELQNDNEELFGYKRVRNIFEKVAQKNPEEIINQLKEDGSSWVSDKDPEDDVTFVVIKVK